MSSVKDYFDQIEGAMIHNIEFREDGFIDFEAIRKDGHRFYVEVLMDPEGNGPGHLAIIPMGKSK